MQLNCCTAIATAFTHLLMELPALGGFRASFATERSGASRRRTVIVDDQVTPSIFLHFGEGSRHSMRRGTIACPPSLGRRRPYCQ